MLCSWLFSWGSIKIYWFHLEKVTITWQEDMLCNYHFSEVQSCLIELTRADCSELTGVPNIKSRRTSGCLPNLFWSNVDHPSASSLFVIIEGLTITAYMLANSEKLSQILFVPVFVYTHDHCVELTKSLIFKWKRKFI